MRKPKVIKKIVPQLHKFTLDSVCKYQNKKEKTLIEMLFSYPNFGVGFKVFLLIRPFENWIVDYVNIKNNRHGKIFGLSYKNEQEPTSLSKIRKTLQPGRWGYEYPQGKIYSENGVEYDYNKIEKLRKEKEELIDKRNDELGIITEKAQILLDRQKRKLEYEKKRK